jgi:homoserine dehydrogenase
VVTANKALLARRGRDLEAAARETGTALRFEAAVAGGVPLLGPLVRHLAANEAHAIRGIVNGTTNYILSRMGAEAREYADVLREAQARGYAEADPRSDVDGHDAASKLAILVRLAFGGWPDVDGLAREVPSQGPAAGPGISGVTRAQLGTAARLGLCLKLVARPRRSRSPPPRRWVPRGMSRTSSTSSPSRWAG